MSNLVLPDENASGITAASHDVGIDLNNFAIIRSGCSPTTIDCTPAFGNGVGVSVIDNAVSGLSVKNGSIVGMGLDAVVLGSQGEGLNLRARWNRQDGIRASNNSRISQVLAEDNGRYGIFTAVGASVTESVASGNGSNGIYASTGTTISRNTVYDNEGDGISFTGGSNLIENTAYRNGDDGISGGFGSTVSDNTAYDNDNDGIAASNGSTVYRNTARSNTGYGLDLGSTAAYRENVITSNASGTVNGGVNMFSNSCDGTTTCPMSL